jgi:thiosulfate dehydrogenase [quinone] large subunit
MSRRNLATVLGVIAALLLLYAANPWASPPEGTVTTAVNIGFWIAAIALVVVLFEDRKSANAEAVEIDGPPAARFLFSNSRAGLFWLPIRLFVGFAWLEAGWHKFTDPEWTTAGAALRAYWERAAAIPDAPGRPPITYEWYRDFINVLLNGHHETWFSWVIILGELAIGIGLIFGILTGLAAFFGALMNMSFLLAGSGSSNPVMFTLAIGLMLAWKVAGYYGVDRYLLPMLGTPWKPGTIVPRQRSLDSPPTG